MPLVGFHVAAEEPAESDELPALEPQAAVSAASATAIAAVPARLLKRECVLPVE